jgi:heme/copper-type cytochrome/quinol oxidase subunit 4
MIAFLALWTAAIWILQRRRPVEQLLVPLPKETHRQPRLSIIKTISRRVQVGPALGCLLLGAVGLCWFAFVAGGATQDELGSVFANAISALFHLVFGGGGTKTLFKAGTGQVDPLVVRVLGLASVGVLALVIPLGVWRVWRDRRTSTLAISLAAVGLLYPFTLVPRLTAAGSEISQRASEFVFVGIGFVAAILFLHLTESLGRQRSRLLALLATGLTGLVFVGGVILGESPVTRQPGRFEVGAESRSISPQGVAAARFAYDHLPHDSRILVDGPNGLLLGSYGELDPVIGSIRGIPITEVFFSKKFNRNDRIVIVHDAIDYIVVDRRLGHSLPIDGYYYDRDEPRANERTNAISGASLRKFNSVPSINRIYDNGPIVIYDTAGVRSR